MKKLKIKIFLLFLAVLILCAAVFMCVYALLANQLDSQKAAERWQGEGDMPYAQISCFMSPVHTLTKDDIYMFRQTVQTKLDEASLDVPEGAGLFRDAWSTSGSVTISSDHGSGTASVIAVGGYYFDFHPIKLLSGSYIAESDVMDDRVLLDEEIAWLLFGGTDLEGMSVQINGMPFYVGGVISREDDMGSTNAYSSGAGIYMSFDAYYKINQKGAECYEILLPEPVDGFALTLMTENFTITDSEMLQNTGRYSVSKIFEIIKDFGTRSMRGGRAVYPYWENAARYYEDWCAFMLFLACAFLVLPAVLLAVSIVKAYIIGRRRLGEAIPEIKEKLDESIDRSRIKRRNKKGQHLAAK